MNIIVTPNDMIERCLWSKYKRFVLKDCNEDKLKEIVAKNEPAVISEDAAYVIGLLKYVATSNLVHRCKLEIDDILQIKSTMFKRNDVTRVYINKTTILKDVAEFRDRFPSYYNADIDFRNAINDLIAYANKLIADINKLEEHQFIIKDKQLTYVISSEVKKLVEL